MILSLNKNITALIFILLFAPFCLKAQTAVEDIQKINEAYLLNQNFSMDIVLTSYTAVDAKKPDEIEYGYARKKGTLLHTKVGNAETISSVNMQLSIDHKNKKILIGDIVKQNNVLPEGMGESIKALLAYCSKVEYANVKGNSAKYILHIPNYTYSRLEFEFNKESWFLEKLVLIMNTDSKNKGQTKTDEKLIGKYVIEYKNINTQAEFPNTEFTSWKYIYKDGNEYKCTQEYKNYQIINKLSNK